MRVPWTTGRSRQSIFNNNWDSTKEAKIATQSRRKLLQKPYPCGESSIGFSLKPELTFDKSRASCMNWKMTVESYASG